MRDFILSFIAGETKEFNVPGNCVHVVSAQNPLEILLDGTSQNSKFTRDTGAVLRPGDFGKVEITSSTAQNVTVCIGRGESYYNGDTLISQLNVGLETADILIALSDVVLTPGNSILIAPASLGRKEVRVSLPESANSPIRFGPNSINATKGGEIFPGTVEYISTSAAIYGFNVGDDDVSVSVLSVEKA